MGYAYNGLIAPAILFDNPGITKEKFVELLGKTHSVYVKEYGKNEAWDYYDSELEDGVYHDGLVGLASLLKVGYSKKYFKQIISQKSKFDENGLEIYPAYPLYFGKRFGVRIHNKNILDNKVHKNIISYIRLKNGDIHSKDNEFEYDLCGNEAEESFLVRKIFSEEYFVDEGTIHWVYNLELQQFYRDIEIQEFESLEELGRAWPIFSPNNVYDWSCKKGRFSVPGVFSNNHFLWKKLGEKYYFDEKSFDLMSEGLSGGTLGYVDLILTAEAVKNNAWKLLSYHGDKHQEDFLRDFPSSRVRYEKAIWDSHTSLFAKEKKMSTSDFLRLRIGGL